MAETHWVDTSRYQGEIDAEKLKARGFHGLIARCTIGLAGVDPFYLIAKQRAEAAGMLFAAYGVTWPANRNAPAEARNFLDKMMPSEAPDPPVFIVGDHELGLHTHWAGHHMLSGGQLVDYAVSYQTELSAQATMPVYFYTARWYWNSSKLLPYNDRGEGQYPVLAAHYPFDPKQFPGIIRYSKDVLDPNDIGGFLPSYPFPWREAPQRLGLQWTSKGRGRIDGYCASTFMDRDIIYLDVGHTPPPPPPPGPEPIVVNVTVPRGKAIVTVEEV